MALNNSEKLTLVRDMSKLTNHSLSDAPIFLYVFLEQCTVAQFETCRLACGKEIVTCQYGNLGCWSFLYLALAVVG